MFVYFDNKYIQFHKISCESFHWLNDAIVLHLPVHCMHVFNPNIKKVAIFDHGIFTLCSYPCANTHLNYSSTVIHIDGKLIGS